MCSFPPRALSLAQACWWRGDLLHSRVRGLYSPWPNLIPELRLCVEATSDCPLPVGLPEPSPRSRELLAPLRGSHGWWEIALEFIFIVSHEHVLSMPAASRTGLKQRGFEKQFEVGGCRISSSAQRRPMTKLIPSALQP